MVDSLIIEVFDLFIYGGLISSCVAYLIAITQLDFKRCIAYLSVAHMSITLVGILVMSFVAHLGCFLLAFSHGLIATMLFAFSGFLMYRYGT